MRLLLIPLLLLSASILLLLSWGSRRWARLTAARMAGLDAGRGPARQRPEVFGEAAIAGLPRPVQRYFRTALRPGQRPIVAAALEHSGQFRIDERRQGSSRFTSFEQVRMAPAAFLWDGRIRMARGLYVHVHDGYLDGEGLLDARIAGLRRVAGQQGPGDLARGQLARYLAEAPWYPTALLPAAGVSWEALDEHSAQATLTEGATTVRLTFRFGGDGLIETVRVEDRPRLLDGRLEPTAWEGRFWNYAERDGILVPLDGEVAWHPSSGSLPPYWRGHLEALRFAYDD